MSVYPTLLVPVMVGMEAVRISGITTAGGVWTGAEAAVSRGFKASSLVVSGVRQSSLMRPPVSPLLGL